MTISPRTCLIFTAVVLLASCDSKKAPPPSQIATGQWRAKVVVPGGDLPFGLELTTRDGTPAAVVINGEERVAVDDVYMAGDSLFLGFRAQNSTINATQEDGRLVGWLSVLKDTGLQTMPFSATFGLADRFCTSPGDPVDVTGRWASDFDADDGSSYPAIGEFQQTGSVVHGTFLTPTGDHRYLAGQVCGPELYLSSFDGYHVYLFKARIQKDGTLQGDFWSGIGWHETWTARRDDDMQLPDPNKVTHLKSDLDLFAFSFPNVDGRIISSSDKVFNGQVVIVTLAGSWCTNCHDEAKYLAGYYKENRDRGLEIVGLMFEHYHDFEKAAGQVKKFRDRNQLEYTLLVAGTSDKKEAAKVLPMLDDVNAYPTTIFIDRGGKVRRIHTGFSGPGTGEHFEDFKRDFEELVDQLLAESS